jgi:multicomponent Na+:H+ antiporter subunit E
MKTLGIRKLFLLIALILFYLWEMFLSNLRVAYYVLSPLDKMRPGVVAVPLDAKTDLEIMLFANFITMTPGTLSLDVSEDRRMLYVHAIYVDDAKQLKKKLKTGFEKRILEILR